MVSKSKLILRSNSVRLASETRKDKPADGSESVAKKPLQVANPENEVKSIVTNPLLARQTSLPSTLNKVTEFGSEEILYWITS